MNEEYKKLFETISEQNIMESRKYRVKKYLLDNLLAILALIVAIVALFK